MDDNVEDYLVAKPCCSLYRYTATLRSEWVDYEGAALPVITIRLIVKLQIALFIMVVIR
jgi:hypothetical protein